MNNFKIAYVVAMVPQLNQLCIRENFAIIGGGILAHELSHPPSLPKEKVSISCNWSSFKVHGLF